MCVASGVQPGPKTIPDGAQGYQMGRTPVYTTGVPTTYGGGMTAQIPAAAQPALPATAVQPQVAAMRPTLPEVATARTAMDQRTAPVDVPGDGRTGPTLPAQASDTARRAVAGEFRGVGMGNADGRTRPTLPAQASDVARRAVAGEMKGKGNNNSGGGNGKDKGNGPGTTPGGDSETSTSGPRRARTARGSRRARRTGVATRRYGGGLNIPR